MSALCEAAERRPPPAALLAVVTSEEASCLSGIDRSRGLELVSCLDRVTPSLPAACDKALAVCTGQ